MRVSMKDVPVRVAVAPTSPSPIRLRLAGLVFGLTPGEAIHLATALADAVETTNKKQGAQS